MIRMQLHIVLGGRVWHVTFLIFLDLGIMNDNMSIDVSENILPFIRYHRERIFQVKRYGEQAQKH